MPLSTPRRRYRRFPRGRQGIPGKATRQIRRRITFIGDLTMDQQSTGRYAGYTRLKFDKPHPKVLRVTMDNGKFNTADRAMHAELARVWRDIDPAPEINAP